MLHPQFESKAELDQQRDSMGPTQFSAQYLQRPIPIDGALMDAAWFRYYDTLPERDADSYILQSWDTASKDGLANAYSTCTTWLVHQQSYYLIDVLRMKLKFPALRDMASALVAKHKPRYVLIEDASTGPALDDELRREQAVGIKLIKPEQDKQVRLYIEQGKFSSKRVWFPRQAPWLRTFLDEMLSFPGSKYSDQVDSLGQALAFKGGYDPGAIVDFLESLTGVEAALLMQRELRRLFRLSAQS